MNSTFVISLLTFFIFANSMRLISAGGNKSKGESSSCSASSDTVLEERSLLKEALKQYKAELEKSKSILVDLDYDFLNQDLTKEERQRRMREQKENKDKLIQLIRETKESLEKAKKG